MLALLASLPYLKEARLASLSDLKETVLASLQDLKETQLDLRKVVLETCREEAGPHLQVNTLKQILNLCFQSIFLVKNTFSCFHKLIFYKEVVYYQGPQ